MAGVLLIAAVAFGICFLVDKGFTKLFRGTKQHKSGNAVRLNKRYGSIGLVLVVLGLSAIIAGIPSGLLLLIGGSVLIVTGVGLVVYYMTFGLYYDEDGFLLTTFGKRSKTYRYGDIFAQQLYNSFGNVVIELHLSDGRTVQLQASMSGVYPFLDKAFHRWLKQTGKILEDCSFYNPQNSCWFPPLED